MSKSPLFKQFTHITRLNKHNYEVVVIRGIFYCLINFGLVIEMVEIGQKNKISA